MAEFNERLNNLIKDNEASKNAGTVTESDLLKIKKIYHRLVKRLRNGYRASSMSTSQSGCICRI